MERAAALLQSPAGGGVVIAGATIAVGSVHIAEVQEVTRGHLQLACGSRKEATTFWFKRVFTHPLRPPDPYHPPGHIFVEQASCSMLNFTVSLPGASDGFCLSVRVVGSWGLHISPGVRFSARRSARPVGSVRMHSISRTISDGFSARDAIIGSDCRLLYIYGLPRSCRRIHAAILCPALLAAADCSAL